MFAFAFHLYVLIALCCLSKKSCPFSYSEYNMKVRQHFFGMQKYREYNYILYRDCECGVLPTEARIICPPGRNCTAKPGTVQVMVLMVGGILW